jgi:hypothetical protein
MKFISSEELLIELEDDLHKYYVNGLESSFLLPKIERQLLEIGVKFLPKKSVTIDIKNNVGKLPKDFHYLILAVSCSSYKVTSPDNTRGTLTYEQRVCDLPVCKTEADYWHDENGRVAIYQRFYGDSFIHKDISMLTVKESIESDECCNPINSGKYDIELKNGLIYTNKNLVDGTIYLEYRGSLDNKGDLLIPDFPEIKEWLMEFCRKETFKRVFNNEDSNSGVVNKLQYSDKELHIAKENARAFWKRAGQSEFYKLRTELINKFNKLARI